MNTPVRYFVLNEKSAVMHIYGFCRHTKKRSVPIRLFDNQQEVCNYAGRSLRLCNYCQAEWNIRKE